MKRIGILLSLLLTFAISSPSFGQWPAWSKSNATAQSVTAPQILPKLAIPLIGLGSCTMSAAGALSACTALTQYANAYCYLPANAAATTIAAGLYYCTFSSTTAGTVFLNTCTAWPCTIPVSPTAVTTGSSFTGDTGEEFMPGIPVSANAMGATGKIRGRIAYQTTNTANAKTPKVHFSGSGGTTIFTTTAVFNGASTTGHGINFEMSNMGVTNSQITDGSVYNPGGVAGWVVGTPSAIDTTAATTLVPSIQRATATDNYIITGVTLELLSDGT